MHSSEPTATALPTHIEGPIWASVDGLWRPLYGSIIEQGYSIEWHDFQLLSPLDWARSFHAQSLEICLNFHGHATVGDGRHRREVGPGEIVIYGARSLARRHPDSSHRFYTVELSKEFLRTQFGQIISSLRPEIRRFLENPGRTGGVFGQFPLSSTLMPLRMHLLEPPVSPLAHPTWYQGKILEIMSATIFEQGQSAELFCHRHRRLNRERVEQVRFLLTRDMANPPSIEMLAQEVQCSISHLSRIFAQETGRSIPQYLRTCRIERAARLLVDEGRSITDVAVEVGYSSLSAFIKAFTEHFGAIPSLYIATARK